MALSYNLSIIFVTCFLSDKYREEIFMYILWKRSDSYEVLKPW